MLLKYAPKQGANMCVVPLIPVSDEAKAVTLTRTQVQFLPGTNEITDDEWLVIKPHIASELKAGVIIPLSQKVAAGRSQPGGRKVKNLIEFPINLAVKYVTECVNPDTLQKWYKEEVRDEVRVRITRRMEKLKVAFPDDPDAASNNASVTPGADEIEDDEDLEEGEGTEVDIEKMSLKELRAYAKSIGVSGLKDKSREDVLEMIAAKQAEGIE